MIEFVMNHLLSVMTFTPLVGIVLIYAIPGTGAKPNVVRGIATVVTGIPLVLGFVLWRGFDPAITGLQFEEHTVWIRTFNIEYFMAVDGISISMVLLTVLISFIACLASFGVEKSVRGFFAMFLLLETGMIGVFCALDFFLFYVFWELMLLPMYFLIGIWGGPRKEYAAIKFFLYTLFGSVLMLLAMIALYYNSRPTTLVDGTPAAHTFNFIKLMAENDFSGAGPILGIAFPKIIFAALFIGFSIKIPMFPFHTWLPDAHVEAPTPISVILAGILLKMGVYGILRVNFTILPEATVWAAPAIAVFGVINMVYGAFVCMAQKDLKKLIAYSSISHMGFCLLAMAAFTDQGISGCVLQMWNHGIISPMLFLIAGVIYDRAHHREIERFGGLAQSMPEYSALTGLAFMASLGLPGLAGFISEALCFLGAFPVFRALTIFSAIAVIITAAYYLWTMQRMFLGKLNEKYAEMKPVTWRERFTLYPLAVIIVILGFYPMPVLDLINPTLFWLVGTIRAAM
ncbi:MAG: NADH-quinone oxidoreductase subunit M [Deltaproteobacteria bacterium]|nr:NADH-quinone oxidoreductase subunit M [Deltaproteobacteria bacterium]